jgi:hypothetical protein
MHNVHLQSPTNQLLQLITSISSSCNLQPTNDGPYNCIQANAFLGLLSGMDSKEFYQLFLLLQ